MCRSLSVFLGVPNLVSVGKESSFRNEKVRSIPLPVCRAPPCTPADDSSPRLLFSVLPYAVDTSDLLSRSTPLVPASSVPIEIKRSIALSHLCVHGLELLDVLLQISHCFIVRCFVNVAFVQHLSQSNRSLHRASDNPVRLLRHCQTYACPKVGKDRG